MTLSVCTMNQLWNIDFESLRFSVGGWHDGKRRSKTSFFGLSMFELFFCVKCVATLFHVDDLALFEDNNFLFSTLIDREERSFKRHKWGIPRM